MNIEASDAIIRGLKAANVDLVAMLPDHGFDRVQKTIAADPSFTFVPVSNEGIGSASARERFSAARFPR